MKRTLFAFAVAVAFGAPAFAQQVDNCNRSGYQTGVTGGGSDVSHEPCDTRATPRVNGVPQSAPQATARPGYNSQQQAQNRDNNRGRAVQNSYDQRSDPRYSGNRNPEWDRYRGEGNVYYGARGPEWRRGGHVPREYMDRQYRVDDWRGHHLSAPPRGYQWVQVGNDYVLVALATGIIAQLLLSH